MARYLYTAKSDPQKTVRGNIEAESEQEAINKILKSGLFPIVVQAENAVQIRSSGFRLKKFSNKDIVLFTTKLSTLLDSGVDIIKALDIVSAQSSDRRLKAILGEVKSKIKDGQSLSDSLAAFPNLFSGLYTSMVHTGEASGNLNDVLKRLANFLEKEEEFKNNLLASLVYPAFVLAVGILTVWALLVFVIPRLAAMFEDMGQALPLPTRILIETSAFFRNFWWLIIASIVILIFFLRRLYATAPGKLMLDNFKLKAAVLGPITLKTSLSRLTRTLSLLISSGIPISPALEISALTIDNQIIRTDLKKFRGLISDGASLSEALKTSDIFPDFMVSIVRIGEETGALEKSLLRIADDYEKDVDRTLKTLTQLLEPVIILIMGLIVGFIVISMLLPIFEMNLLVK